MKDNPLYLQSPQEINKNNKELKRSITALEKILSDSTSRQFLTPKKFSTLEKGLEVYKELLFKREGASAKNDRRVKQKEMDCKKGAILLKKALIDKHTTLTVELMIEILIADNINYRLWEYTLEEIEKDMQSLLKQWGYKVKCKEEATDFIKRLYEAMGDKTHKQYNTWKDSVRKILEEYAENN